MNEFKMFIDNEIKSINYIFLNIFLTIKKDSFLEKIEKINNNNKFLNLDKNYIFVSTATTRETIKKI